MTFRIPIRNALRAPEGGELWRVVVGGVEQGPLGAEELALLCSFGVIDGDTPIRGEQWHGWATCAEVLRALQVVRGAPPAAAQAPAPESTPEPRAHRIALPRRSDVVALLHDGERLVRCPPLDVSLTGAFVAAAALPFPIGRLVTLTVKAPGLLPAFSVPARIVRFNDDPRHPTGFGLVFEQEPAALARQWEAAA